MKKLGFVVLALLIAGCSSDDEELRGSGITGHSEAIELTEDEVLSSLETLFIDEAGMRPELAECYTDFFETEGLASSIQNLSDLATVQTEFTTEQAQAYADCGPATIVEESFDDLVEQ